jgi:hypothetical protein
MGTVENVEDVNHLVQRIQTDSNIVLDVYKPALTFEIGDRLGLNVSKVAKTSDPVLLMHGIVYHTDSTRGCISFGGLLCSLPVSIHKLCRNEQVYVKVEKNNRKRNMKEAVYVEQSRKRKN